MGGILTAVPGVWGPGSVALTYQWKANGTAISGATASTFTITAAQLGSTITVAVTGTETGYATATVESAATATIVGSTFTTIGTPTITGTPVVGGTLTAGTGTWAPTPDSYSYQWKANGTAISGATASTYVAAASVVGQTITVTVDRAQDRVRGRFGDQRGYRRRRSWDPDRADPDDHGKPVRGGDADGALR